MSDNRKEIDDTKFDTAKREVFRERVVRSRVRIQPTTTPSADPLTAVILMSVGCMEISRRRPRSLFFVVLPSRAAIEETKAFSPEPTNSNSVTPFRVLFPGQFNRVCARGVDGACVGTCLTVGSEEGSVVGPGVG